MHRNFLITSCLACVLFNDVFSTEIMLLRMVKARGKDLEGNSCSLTEVVSRYFR
jgi:hypothetical protein